jgi:exodeoxyribonuclease VII small subunit
MTEQADGAVPHPIDLFEQLVSEVEAIVQRLENENLPLAEAIREYQRGIELIRQCNAILDQAELQISQLRTSSPEAGLALPADLRGFPDSEDDSSLA